LNKASCYEKLGAIGDAVNELKLMIAEQPTNPCAYTRLAIVLTEFNRFGDALNAVNAALERTPTGHAGGAPEVYYGVGGVPVNFLAYRLHDLKATIALRVGDYKGALEHATTAIQGDMTAAAAAMTVEKLVGVDSFVGTSDGFGEAGAVAAMIQAGVPPLYLIDPEPYMHRGAVHLALGDPVQAIADLLYAHKIVESHSRRDVRRELSRDSHKALGEPTTLLVDSGGESDEEDEDSPAYAPNTTSSKTRYQWNTSRTMRGDHEPTADEVAYLAPELAVALGEPQPPVHVMDAEDYCTYPKPLADDADSVTNGRSTSSRSAPVANNVPSPRAQNRNRAKEALQHGFTALRDQKGNIVALADTDDFGEHVDALIRSAMRQGGGVVSRATHARIDARLGLVALAEDTYDKESLSGVENELRATLRVDPTRIGRDRRNRAAGEAVEAEVSDDDADSGAPGRAGKRGSRRSVSPLKRSISLPKSQVVPQAALLLPALGGTNPRGAPLGFVIPPATIAAEVWPTAEPAFTMPRNRQSAKTAAEVHFLLGIAYEALGHHKRALYHLHNSLQAWPGSLSARYLAALILQIEGRFDESAAQLTLIVKMSEGFDGDKQLLSPRSVSRIMQEVFTSGTGLKASLKLVEQTQHKQHRASGAAAKLKASDSLVEREFLAKKDYKDAAALALATATGKIFSENLTADEFLSAASVANERASASLWTPGSSKSSLWRYGVATIFNSATPGAGAQQEEARATLSGPQAGEASDGKPASKSTPVPPRPQPFTVTTVPHQHVLERQDSSSSTPDDEGPGAHPPHSPSSRLAFAFPVAPINRLASLRAKSHVLVSRGLAEQAQGHHKEAVDDFTRAIEADPSLGATYLHRAVSHLVLKRGESAMADCAKALQLGYQHILVHMCRGEAAAHLGVFSEAVNSYTKALEINPKYAPALRLRAIAYRALNLLDEAEDDLKKALNDTELAARPNVTFSSADGGTRLVNPELGTLIVDSNVEGRDQFLAQQIPAPVALTRREEPVPAADRSLYGQALVLCQRAQVRYAKNDFDGALYDYEEAISKGSLTANQAAEVHYRVGLCLANLEHNERAADHFDKCMRSTETYAETFELVDAALAFLSAHTGVLDAKYGSLVRTFQRAQDTADKQAARTPSTSSPRASVSLSKGLTTPTLVKQPEAGRALVDSSRSAVSGSGARFVPAKMVTAHKSSVTGDFLTHLMTIAQNNTAGNVPIPDVLKSLPAVLRPIASAWANGLDISSMRRRVQDQVQQVMEASLKRVDRILAGLWVNAAHEKAKALQLLGDHDEAIRYFTLFLAACPSSSAGYLRRAFSYKCLKFFDASADDFETAKQLDPMDTRLLMNYNALHDISTVILNAPGEEKMLPIVGVTAT
jgi:tetratricopeptide (TPR) repeat protein